MDRNKAKGMLWGLIVGDTFVKWFADASPDARHRHARPEAPRGEYDVSTRRATIDIAHGRSLFGSWLEKVHERGVMLSRKYVFPERYFPQYCFRQD